MNPASAKKALPVPAAELAAITARGRMLSAYDKAITLATTAVLEINAHPQNSDLYFCRKAENWICKFGALDSAGKFLIQYESEPKDSPEKFTAVRHNPAVEAEGSDLAAAKAIATAMRDFQATAEKRPYDFSVLPAGEGQLYVYIVPSQTSLVLIRWAEMHVI